MLILDRDPDLAGERLLIQIEALTWFSHRDLLGSNRIRRRFGADTRIRNTVWLDVAASLELIVTRR